MTFPSLLQTEGERPHGRSPWVWMWDLELQKRTISLPPVVFRMTSADQVVAWPPRGTVAGPIITVTTLGAPTRGRFTASSGTFATWVVGALADVAGSALGALGAGGNNATQVTVYAVDPGGSWVELLGAFVAETRKLGMTLGPTTVTYYPFPFTATEIEQTQEGDLPSLDLAIDNTARTLMSVLHDGGGFAGNRATLTLTHSSSLLAPVYPNHQEIVHRFTISSAAASSSTVQLRLESPSFFQQSVPRDRFIAKRCRWLFGGRECGYPITAFAAFTTCNKDVTDCVARGDDEVARFLPRLHPQRFGGFPGIPQQRAPR